MNLQKHYTKESQTPGFPLLLAKVTQTESMNRLKIQANREIIFGEGSSSSYNF